jgi:hypothetical protein
MIADFRRQLFSVRASDGNLYILRHDQGAGFMDADEFLPGPPAANHSHA